MRPHLTVLTLATGDLTRAVRFYRALGLPLIRPSRGGFALFGLGSLTLALCEVAVLARELAQDSGSFEGTTSRIVLSHNVADEADVEAVLRAVVAAGGRVVRPASRAGHGGLCGSFRDPDDHLWEIVHNPRFALDERGGLCWPE